MHSKLRKISLFVMSGFYILAAINHFINPEFYLPLIPPFLPTHETLNYAAGVAEAAGGLLLLNKSTRKFAGWGIVLMLLAFLPVHIYMLQRAPVKSGFVTITPLFSWFRLFFQAVLILWAVYSASLLKPSLKDI